MTGKADNNFASSALKMLKGHAEYALAMNCYYGIGPRYDHIEAAAHFQEAALLGHPDAQSCLGWMYLHGDGVPRYSREAFRWFREAASQGSADGMCRLALMYVSGEHVEQNLEEAEKLFKQAAEKNHAESMYYLGLIGILSDGSPDDQIRAVEWIQAAANAGFADAIYAVGCFYRDGRYLKHSMQDAIIYLEKAAAGNQMDAALALGILYETPGAYHNPERSRLFYLKAADLGNDDATSRIATMYMNSSQDFLGVVSMVPVLSSAAERGHPDAAYVMGCFCQTHKADTEAANYFSIASKGGNQKAQLKLRWLSATPKRVPTLSDIVKKSPDRLQSVENFTPVRAAFKLVREARAANDEEAQNKALEDSRRKTTEEARKAEDQVAAEVDNENSAERSDKGVSKEKDPEKSLVHQMYSARPLPVRGHAPAIKWLLAVRMHRDAELLLRLANAYYADENKTADDLTKSFQYFLRAAELGNAEAAYRLAMMYLRGEGTISDAHKAQYWIERSAAQHHELACEQLEAIRKNSAQ